MYSLSPSVFLSLVYRKATCKSYLHSVSPIPLLLFTHEPTLITVLLCSSIKTVLIKSIYDFLIAKSSDWFLVLMLFILLAAFDIIYYFFPRWTLSSLDFQDTIFSLSGCSVSNIFATFTLSSWLLNIGVSQGSVLGPLLFNKCSTHAENSTLTYPTTYLISPLGCIVDNSNSRCQNSWSIALKTPFPILLSVMAIYCYRNNSNSILIAV